MWKTTYPRTVPERRPAGHKPRAPRWTIEFDEPTSLVTCDYLAVQSDSLESASAQNFFATVRSARADEADGPEVWELLSFVDDSRLGERRASGLLEGLNSACQMARDVAAGHVVCCARSVRHGLRGLARSRSGSSGSP